MSRTMGPPELDYYEPEEEEFDAQIGQWTKLGRWARIVPEHFDRVFQQVVWLQPLGPKAEQAKLADWSQLTVHVHPFIGCSLTGACGLLADWHPTPMVRTNATEELSLRELCGRRAATGGPLAYPTEEYYSRLNQFNRPKGYVTGNNSRTHFTILQEPQTTDEEVMMELAATRILLPQEDWIVVQRVRRRPDLKSGKFVSLPDWVACVTGRLPAWKPR